MLWGMAEKVVQLFSTIRELDENFCKGGFMYYFV